MPTRCVVPALLIVRMLLAIGAVYVAVIDIREATPADGTPVLKLLASAMSRPNDERFGRLFDWKHRANPFGASPAWVAEVDGEIAGYRAFLRWEFDQGGATRRAVRAVDTATDPAHQGKGIFRALTMHALDVMGDEGVDFVFNTPNDNSRPGYLKMGWQMVGTLQPRVRPRSIASLRNIARARVPAGHWGERTDVGGRTEEVFADDAATTGLLRSSSEASRLTTVRSPAYLRWRYDADLLGYRVLTLGRDLAEGAACFRLRRRGPAVEATIGDLLVPGGDRRARRQLIGKVLKATKADYALALDGSWHDGTLPMPGQGPTLVWRAVTMTEMPALDQWALTMGDVELF